MQWKAYYKDGSDLSQYNADGSENKYKNIDRESLSHFVLFEGKDVRFACYLHKDQRLIFRRRTYLRGDEKAVIYLVGWQMTVGGRNIKSIAYITPTHVETDNDRNDLELLNFE